VYEAIILNQRISKIIKSKSFVKIVIAILFIGLVSYCSYTLISNYSDISRLNAQAAELNKQYETQLKDNEKIKAILDSDNQDEYIEQKAREKGYVKDGETVFYDIS
jgi:cell division protein FtsB